MRLRLRYWIDGRPLDDMAKTLPAGKAWIPTVVITEPELEVVLNPFCVSSDPPFSSGLVPSAVKELHEDGQSGGQRTFPAALCEPLAALQSAFLASQLREYLVAVDIPTKDAAGDAISVQDCLKQVVAPTKKVDQEEGKEEEPVAVVDPEPAQPEPTLPKFETHAFSKPAANKSKDKNNNENEIELEKDKDKD